MKTPPVWRGAERFWLPMTADLRRGAAMPTDWMEEAFKDSTSKRTNYCDNHLFGDVPKSLTDFRGFYDARSQEFRSRILKLLSLKPATTSDP